MTNSEEQPDNAEQPEWPTPEEGESYAAMMQRLRGDGSVLGVLTGQVPVRSMPVAGRDLDGEMIPDEQGS